MVWSTRRDVGFVGEALSSHMDRNAVLERSAVLCTSKQDPASQEHSRVQPSSSYNLCIYILVARMCPLNHESADMGVWLDCCHGFLRLVLNIQRRKRAIVNQSMYIFWGYFKRQIRMDRVFKMISQRLL